MKVSVIVCSYNSNIDKLKYTLDSIVTQTLDDYEVIVCDDGSKCNNQEFLEDYFKDKSVKYKLVLNDTNKGTIENIISGINVSEGEYIKPIGVGDRFSEADALKNVYEYMEEQGAVIACVDMNFICAREGQELHRSIPLRKDRYIKSYKFKEMQENVIVFNDQFCGAGLFYKKEYFEKYLSYLKGKVKYIEDSVQYFFLLDGFHIKFINHKYVDYEIGEGISTNRKSDNNERMLKDKKAFLEILFERYSPFSFVKRRRRLASVDERFNNKIAKGIFKLLYEPKWLFFRINR